MIKTFDSPIILRIIFFYRYVFLLRGLPVACKNLTTVTLRVSDYFLTEVNTFLPSSFIVALGSNTKPGLQAGKKTELTIILKL